MKLVEIYRERPEPLRAGDFLTQGQGEQFVVATVACCVDGGVQACLVSLKDGNRYKDPVVVQNPRNITEEEARELTKPEFALFSRCSTVEVE